jgi:hypothetical protein
MIRRYLPEHALPIFSISCTEAESLEVTSNNGLKDLEKKRSLPQLMDIHIRT